MIVQVAPFTGAWIEMTLSPAQAMIVAASHPSRVRGLKSKCLEALRLGILVAPFTGAWIEINE